MANNPVVFNTSSPNYILLFIFSLLPFGLLAQNDKKIKVDSISVIGLYHTKYFVIERELLFKKDSIYDSSQLQSLAHQSKNLLRNTNLFSLISITIEQTNPNHCRIRVDLIERWYVWPIPFFELADRNFKQWANLGYQTNRINYGIHGFIYNIRGRNETIKVSLSNGYTKYFSVQYLNPNINKSSKYGLEFGASGKQNTEIWYLTKNDSLQFYKNYSDFVITRFETRIAFITRHTNYFTEKWELSAKSIKTKDTLFSKTLNPTFLLSGNSQRETFIHHFLNLEKRDNKYYPLSGYYLKNEVSLGNIQSDTIAVELLKETFEFGIYKKIYKTLYLSCFYKTKLSNQPKPFIPYVNNASFGYKDYVRGYEQFVIDGHAFMLGKLNLKYALVHQYGLKLPLKNKIIQNRIPTGVYINFYADWGKVFNNTIAQKTYNNTLTNTDLIGYGSGLDLVFFNDKIIRIEYTYTLLGYKNFNLHFGKAF